MVERNIVSIVTDLCKKKLQDFNISCMVSLLKLLVFLFSLFEFCTWFNSKRALLVSPCIESAVVVFCKNRGTPNSSISF